MKLRDLKIYFKMFFHYRPKTFWNELLSNSFDLRGVGHYRLSEEENLKMYQEKERIIKDELQKNNIKITCDTAVLEIGCGTGYWTEFLRSLGVKNYTGNDIAEISIVNLKMKYPEYNFVQGDISEIPLPDKSYDLAMMIDVTQHITDDRKFNAALNNIWQSLRPGSYFLVTLWDPGKNVYLANKFRLNRIEKPRGIQWYKKIIRDEGIILSNVEFNDKYLLTIKKH